MRESERERKHTERERIVSFLQMLNGMNTTRELEVGTKKYLGGEMYLRNISVLVTFDFYLFSLSFSIG